MKKMIMRGVILCVMGILVLGCAAAETQLIVFAAASLTETLTELSEGYCSEHSDTQIYFNFDSSGTLKTQIQEGADCDIFISAGQKQMDQLDADASPAVNTEGLDFLLPNSRFDILENKVALVVPKDNPAGISSYADMAEGLKEEAVLLAMGNADVPVGQYTQKILRYFGIDEESLCAVGAVTYGSNVKEVVTQVSEALVDCGVVYQTDAYSAGLDVVDVADEEMCGRVVYPAAILKDSANIEAARAFLDYLIGEAGDAAFSAVGFTPIA